MLDHELHVQWSSYLRDELIGAQGYCANLRDIPYIQISIPGRRIGSDGSLRQQAAPDGRRVVFNDAQCFVDDDHYQMTDDEALLSPARARAFLLGTKQFAFVLVDNIRDVEFNVKAFEALKMQDRYKDLIYALCTTHDAHGKDRFDDVVYGKGRGLIISLEGPPGSGKTLTAGE